MSLTAAQQEAIHARGNVLVVAGAGTGKTCTLVERCLSCLLDEKPKASLDQILMVTFTDAAAAEMRQRIRRRLEEELEARRGKSDELAVFRHLQEQLALFEAAHIGTLHSFCLQLVRQHFYELELDPQLAVMPEEEARLLADETLDEILERHYAGGTPAATKVQELIEAQGRGGDVPIRALVMRLHNYMQTRPDAEGWFAGQRAMFAAPKPVQWETWLREGLAEWAASSLPSLDRLGATNEVAAKCGSALKELGAIATAGKSGWRAEAAAVLKRTIEAPESCPRGKKGAFIRPLESLLKDADFLSTLVEVDGKQDPLADDWKWTREQMLTLLDLAREFTNAFTEAKRELGAVDFHDLEQYALRLLRDHKSGELTAIAKEWRKQLRFVFVDEYQDINAAQDKITQGLSRDGAQGNRFLVGDVKQSIYRFRLAEPRIFQGYADAWGRSGKLIPLVDNFRSREGILNFVNSLFGLLMRRDVGGVEYDEQSRLRFGGSGTKISESELRAEPRSPHPPSPPPLLRTLAEERAGERRLSIPQELTRTDVPSRIVENDPCVELHLRLKPGKTAAEKEAAETETPNQIGDLEEANKEARMVAVRLKELKSAGHQIWDAHEERHRAVKWSDMAVLLRSPSNKAESYAKEFSGMGVPLEVSRGGFYDSIEISDLLSLLRVLDNPLQDVPLLAVLHSPVGGLDATELARIRLAAQGTFWTALVRCNEPGAAATLQPDDEDAARSPETLRKVAAFLTRFGRWRKLARQGSLSRCLESVLAETHYGDWLLTQDRGEQREANVRRLLALARQFDAFQRQGLYRFLHFVEAQQEADTEPDVAAVPGENAVRLMSIHQSKGLEFPIVVVADLGKIFNEADLRADLILDEQYGLCPHVKPPDAGTRYPSLPYWLARRRQRREMAGEELRLLYVAATRARDLLILSGTVTQAKFEKEWAPNTDKARPDAASARAYSDWLAAWFARNVADTSGARQGQNELLRWKIYEDADLCEAGEASMAEEPSATAETAADPEVWQAIQKRLEWSYPFIAATQQPAKTSVTLLRQQLAEQRDEAASALFEPDGTRGARPRRRAQRPVLPDVAKAVDVGRVHHTFLELLLLERTGSVDAIRQEAKRLELEGVLTAEESALLDVEAVAAFWQSEIGQKVRGQAPFVRRELPFTARFPAVEAATLAGASTDTGLEGEFVVVQGVADLVVILPEEIWLVDFKTDSVTAQGLADKVKLYEPQLKLYAAALSRIYRKPVSQCWLYFLDRRAAASVQPS